MIPQIISAYDGGKHNANLDKAVERLDQGVAYKDLSTVIVIPTIKPVPIRVVSSWLGLMSPPNNRTCRLFTAGMEIGEAYTRTIESILIHPDLSNWKYVLFIESDNAPPPDGVLNLLAKMEKHPEYAAIGGLYFTKGHGGVAQIWGDPHSAPFNFRPQKPDVNGGLVECNGTGMGFTVFRLAMFKDPKLRRPWFKTTSSRTEGMTTQDLYFWSDARKCGYRCAIDCSIKVGHYSEIDDTMW